MVEAVRPFKLDYISIAEIYKVFVHLLLLWIGIWMYIHTITTSSITQLFGELADMVLDEGLVQTMHYTMVEAVRPFKLDTTSISYIYKVFDYLLLLWIGICMYIHTITTSSITQLLVSWLKF